MNREAFLESVRDDNDTALSRLGSSKSLYALTAGEMEPDVVLARAADLAYHAAETFDEWGDEREAFADAAETERDHYETIAGELDDHEPGDPADIYAALSGLEDTAARLGGFLGWAIVTDATVGQLTGYFTGQADPQTSQLFRGLRGDVEALRDAALDDLADRGDDETAREAAGTVIQAAYDDYVETLESLGVNPKPVC